MKIAILVQCHKNPEQLKMMFEVLQDDSFCFFIHLDKKATVNLQIQECDRIHVLPDKYRVDVQWSKISQVDATLNLLKYAMSTDDFDYYWVCSGQDFPIKTSEEILSWFNDNDGHNYIELFKSKNNELGYENNYDKRNAIFFPTWMLGKTICQRVIKRIYNDITGGYHNTFCLFRRRPLKGINYYFGSSWICIKQELLKWIFNYLDNNPQYYKFFCNCNCPDESFFQTLIMNSPYADTRKDYLHYVDWSNGGSSPKILDITDMNHLLNSDKLMARKFDVQVDKNILDLLYKRVHL